MKITVTKNGPYAITGNIPISIAEFVMDEEGHPIEYKDRGPVNSPAAGCSLCRCGQSKNKPFCDSSHIANQFDGTTTASHEPFESCCSHYPGDGIVLHDDPALCADVGFCAHGLNAWEYTKESSDPDNKAAAIKEACLCPSGRLVVYEDGSPVETEFEPSIVALEDTQDGCSCAYWVRGGIPVVDEEGNAYEVRNRQTLCRCGQSKNKPFCDGSHYKVSFDDGLTKL